VIIPPGLVDLLVWLGLQLIFYVGSRIQIPGEVGRVIEDTRDRIESDESASREQRALAHGSLAEARIHKAGFRASLGAVLTSLLMFGYFLPDMALLLFIVRFIVLAGGAVGVVYCFLKMAGGVRGANESLVLPVDLGASSEPGATRSAERQPTENGEEEKEGESEQEPATDTE
jgi:hypothetical protein